MPGFNPFGGDAPGKLTDYFYLGSEAAAEDREALLKLGITHVLNVADDVECCYTDTFEYLHCQIADGGEDASIVSRFKDATDFVLQAASGGGKVLVHCSTGIDRSAIVAMAVLMNLEGWTLQQAYDHTKTQRSQGSPSIGNKQKIAMWERDCRRECTMPDWLPDSVGDPSDTQSGSARRDDQQERPRLEREDAEGMSGDNDDASSVRPSLVPRPAVRGNIDRPTVIDDFQAARKLLPEFVFDIDSGPVTTRPSDGTSFTATARNLVSGSLNAAIWHEELLCERIDISFEPVEKLCRRNGQTISKKSFNKLFQDELSPYFHVPITACTTYRHLFHWVAPESTYPSKFLHHAFTILEFGCGRLTGTRLYVCIEKFNDRLELMWGFDMEFYLYATIFRAFAVERPISKARVLVEEYRNDEMPNCVTLSQFKEWLGYQLDQENAYDLVDKNCQHFTHDLLTMLGVVESASSTLSNTIKLQYRQHTICTYTIELPGLALGSIGSSSVQASFIEGVKSLFNGWCTCGDGHLDVEIVVSSVFVRVLVVPPNGVPGAVLESRLRSLSSELVVSKLMQLDGIYEMFTSTTSHSSRYAEGPFIWCASAEDEFTTHASLTSEVVEVEEEKAKEPADETFQELRDQQDPAGPAPGGMPEDDDEKASRGSVSSLKSKSSKFSVVSKASAGMAAMKRGATSAMSFKFSPGSRGSVASVATTDSVRQMVDFGVGDQAEVLSTVTMRAGEGMDTAMVAELSVGTLLTVVALGQGRRVQVEVPGGSGGEANVGWISTKTKLNEALVMKRGLDLGAMFMDFEKGGVHEIWAAVTVRSEEMLESEILQELQPGMRVKIEEIGKTNNRRVKISQDGQPIGWISTCTRHGEPLIGKVSDDGKAASGKSGMFGASSTKIKTLLEAARSNDLDELKRIVEGGSGVMSKFSSRPNLNSSDIRGKNCLIYACAFGHKEIVLYLLTKTKEVDVNAVDDTSKSAMHHSCKRAKTSSGDTINVEVVSALIEADANKEARDHNGCTPLMFAVANGDQRVVQRLITAQANLNVKDYEGHTCLDYATNFGHTELFRMLKSSGAQSGVPEDDREELEEEEAAEEQAAAEEEAASPQADKASKDEGSGEVKKKVKKKKTTEEGALAAEGEEKPKAEAKKKTKKKVGDKEKEEKKKVKKRMSGVGLGMAEALAQEPEDPKAEVTVEVVTEESNAQQRALKKVEVLLKDPKVTAAELKGALDVAKGANVPASELAEAEAKHQELAEKALALQQLKAAIQDRSVLMLQETLKKAEALKLSKKDIEQAKTVLKEEEPKEEARKKLIAAASSGDVKVLKKAIKDATKVGVSASELTEYEELLKGSENKEAAAKALKGALDSLDIPALKIAISQAKEAGIDAATVEQAEKTLAVEEPKSLARDAIEEAVDAGDVDKIQAAIEMGKKAGLDASEIKAAEEVVKKEGEKVKLLAKVTEVMQETMSCDMKDVDSVRAAKEKLNDAILAALAIGVKEDKIYDAEVRRKKLHNTVEDLKGSIRVFCRIRPLSKKETAAGDTNVAKQINVQTVEVGGHQFSFDSVWTPGTQEEVFEDCKDLVQSAVDGYNVTMFAYGQTGAGKTFTMGGVPGNLGVSPRTIAQIFKILAENENRFQFTVMGSMLELYRSDLVDLLCKGDPKTEKKKLNVRQEKNGAVTIENLSEETCANAKELEDLLERGNKARTVAATAMNSESSRSHLVLIIKIISVNKETKAQLRGKLLICDLAGSERLSKSQVTGDGQKEAIEINKSLTSLGDVIEGLTKGAKVIPYRNHKLTQLMQDSLGGTAKTLMFINCSPANSNQDETIMALKYAQRAKTITNKR